MRQSYIVALLLGLGTITQAHAGLLCTPQSCIDTRTGYYTQSTCDYSGCRPLSGVVGRVGPGGYDSAYDYGRPRYYGRHGRFRGYYGDQD
jgi:hypothetical protein